MAYEYRLIEKKPGWELINWLNSLGKEGWELASVVKPYHSSSPHEFYFKREIKETNPLIDLQLAIKFADWLKESEYGFARQTETKAQLEYYLKHVYKS